MSNSLTLMVGVPASGKSTFSKELAAKTGAIRLSSDELRGVIGKDESDQSVTDKVFRAMQAITQHLLAQGYSVIIDATNITPKGRRIFLEAAAKVGNVPTIAYIFDVPIEVLKARNAGRERKVPEEIIERYLRTMCPPLLGEVDVIKKMKYAEKV